MFQVYLLEKLVKFTCSTEYNPWRSSLNPEPFPLLGQLAFGINCLSTVPSSSRPFNIYRLILI